MTVSRHSEGKTFRPLFSVKRRPTNREITVIILEAPETRANATRCFDMGPMTSSGT